MKQMKYFLMGALLMGIGTAATAQDGTANDIAAVKSLIKSKPADMKKQMKAYYGKNKKNPENLVAFGRAFYEAKDTANARVYAQYALAASKNKCAPAYVLLGDIAAMSDDGGAAAQNYEQAIYVDPKNPDPYRKYASVYRKIDPAGAVQKLEELRQQRPDYAVDALIGHINYISLRYGKANEAFSKVPVGDLSRMDFIEYAMSNFHGRDFAKALDIAKHGLQRNALNPTLTRIAMMCSNETEKFDDALIFADQLFNKCDKDSVTFSEIDYQSYGRALAGNERYAEAIEKFQQALQALSPDDRAAEPELYRAISDAYKDMKDYPNAIESYKTFLQKDPEVSATDYASLALLASNYARTLDGDAKAAAMREADQVYADLVVKFPDAEEYALWQRGRLNASMDPDMKQGLALPHFERMIELIDARTEHDETDLRRLEDGYRYLMSYNYSVLKNNSAALTYAKKILEVKPDDEGIRKVVETLSKH